MAPGNGQCASRILHLFVKNIAGINIFARQSVTPPVRPLHRPFSARPYARLAGSVRACAEGERFAIANDESKRSKDPGKLKEQQLVEQTRDVQSPNPAGASSAAAPSKFESRRQRKLRRIAAGSFRVKRWQSGIETLTREKPSTRERNAETQREGDHRPPRLMPTFDGDFEKHDSSEEVRLQGFSEREPEEVRDKNQSEIGSEKIAEREPSGEQTAQLRMGAIQARVVDGKGSNVVIKAKAQNKDKKCSSKSTSKHLSEARKTTSQKQTPSLRPNHEQWKIQKAALDRKFEDQGWQPRKRLSPDALDGIRALHKSDPEAYSTATLAEHFQVSPEAIRRILKSKWRPSAEEAEERRQRWEKRGVRKWTEMAEQGMRPPKKWRDMGIGSTSSANERRVHAMQKNSGRLSWSEDMVGLAGRETARGLGERLL